MMTELEKTVALFNEIGLGCSAIPMLKFDMTWFRFPSEWADYNTVRTVAGILVFDKDGKFVGISTDDGVAYRGYLARETTASQ